MTTKIQEFIVNLDLPASQRWQFLQHLSDQVNDLIRYYLNDFDDAHYLFESIGEYKQEIITQDYFDEIEYIASISEFSADEILIANLYYDALKFYFGCTAFAVESHDKIYHARNLDWWTDNNILSDYSKIFIFQRNGRALFKTVGWPGFIGALSGVKPHHFAITLNAVLSDEPPEIAVPISFFIRDILTSARSYQEAKRRLQQTTIASDCLLLLSGIKKGEMCVIERTPKLSAVRQSSNHFITVTNDYKILSNNVSESNLLKASSCGRFERAQQLLADKHFLDAQICFNILKDPKVMMDITVQQMVFCSVNGCIELIKTS